jgi:hypothetical protein
MSQGLTVNNESLAIRVGELRAVAGQVGEIITALDLTGGDLGPGDIAGAVAEVADQWRSNLGDMRDKIDEIAENVADNVYNYDLIEQSGEERMRRLAEGLIGDEIVAAMRNAAPVRPTGGA